MNFRDIQQVDYAGWMFLTFATSVAAFPVLCAAAWIKSTGQHMTSKDRAVFAATSAAKAILPLWGLTAIIGFLLVTMGITITLWLYSLFGAKTGGINLAEFPWLIRAPFLVLYSAWYIFCLFVVIRWLLRSPERH